MWLSVLGSVYDVSSGEFYTSGGGYAFFAGRDATRAFTTGEFEGEGLSDDVDGLTPAQCKGLRGGVWAWGLACCTKSSCVQ